MIPRPSPGDYAPFFQGYIDLVPDGDVLAALATQSERTQRLLRGAGEGRGDFRYADGKWSVKQVVQHIADGERMFCYRALCLARGDDQPLPGFDENAYAENDGSSGRTLASIVDEYASVRAATLTLFAGFNGDAWRRRGTANGQAIAVCALPWIALGHERHHCRILVERYGLVEPG